MDGTADPVRFCCAHEAQTQVVPAIVRRVPVPVCGAAVPGVVVPAPATVHTVVT